MGDNAKAMRATFALLGPDTTYNLVRKLAWDIHWKYDTGTLHCRLPPHVSLKQPFKIEDLAALESYMSELAASLPPINLHLTELQVEPLVYDSKTYGLLWIEVQETEELRHLHNRLNKDLEGRFGNTQAAYDGEGYRFHMTVMMGGQPLERYQRWLDEQATATVALPMTASELAMFVYEEPIGPRGEYLCYKIMPLGKE